MNDSFNALQMMQLPFALIPVLTFTSSKAIMHNFQTGIFFRVFLSIVGFFAICINLFFLYDFIYEKAPHDWPVFLAVGVFTFVYFCFLIYLVFYLFMSMIGEDRLRLVNLIFTSVHFSSNHYVNFFLCCKKIFPIKRNLPFTFPWLTTQEQTNVDEPIDPLERRASFVDQDKINVHVHTPPNCCEECRNQDSMKF